MLLLILKSNRVMDVLEVVSLTSTVRHRGPVSVCVWSNVALVTASGQNPGRPSVVGEQPSDVSTHTGSHA